MLNSRYLDPKNDIPFKKVFGRHDDLCISLLNNLLPLEGRKITEIHYLSNEMLPRIDVIRNSLVDVRCKDNTGRQFIVEMQMYWTDSFKNRVLFNASKAYVEWFDTDELKARAEELREKGKKLDVFKEVPPVYSLNLINAIFERSPEMAEEYYHHYAIVNLKHTEKRVEGLELIFVELPKFKPTNKAERKFHEMWLRYLTEVSLSKNEVPADLLEIKETRKAIELLERYSYTTVELYQYDMVRLAVWMGDALLVAHEEDLDAERANAAAAEEKAAAAEEKAAAAEEKAAAAEEKAAAAEENAAAAAKEAAAERAKAAAAQAAIAAERAESIRVTARALKAAGVSAEVIAQTTGLPAADIAKL
jgi:chemotaxis protein histidine kinase CheA